jgi:hypothetical protein
MEIEKIMGKMQDQKFSTFKVGKFIKDNSIIMEEFKIPKESNHKY